MCIRDRLRTIVFGVVGSALYVAADDLGQRPAYRPYAPWVVVAARFLGGVWTGGKMVVEQTYVGVAALEERVTPLTSDIGVFAVLGFVAGPSVGALFAPVDFAVGDIRVDQFTAPGWFMVFLTVAMWFGSVWKSTAGLGGPHQTSSSAKSKSIRLVFG